VVALFVFAAPVLGQQRQFTVEGSFVRGALAYAREVRPRLLAGVEVGFGLPELDRTFVPEQDSLGGPDFDEYLHVSTLLRMTPATHLDVDTGLRFSLVELYGCSGCLPEPFAGAYLQPMVGWRRLKFGARLTAGWVFQSGPGQPDGSTAVVGLNPFIVRYTFAW
jgi:hypothetical protein